ncbi:MAG: hypothetical protein LBF40_10005 [Deltaproteobacteria bacterium]|nr:hypothetical protein [Deltaproteobacteria bacterium]
MDFPIQVFILAQIVLELSLFVLLILVFFRTGRKGSGKGTTDPIPTELQSTITRFISESERISQSFSQNLEDKKKLSTELIMKLDLRLESYKRLLAETEAALGRAVEKLGALNDEGARLASLQGAADTKANPAAPEVRALVLKLAKEGLSVEEIAVRARLNRGEVELIMDLEDQFGGV